MTRAVLAALLACASAWAQAEVIAGVVVTPDGRPAKRVRVAVAPSESAENQTAVITGENGAFRFENLRAGKYRLTAEPPAGGSQSFGQRTLSKGFGTAIVTGPDLHNDNLVFRLVPMGAIRGRVVDAEGEGVEGALVQIFVSTFLRGKRSVFYVGSRYTDDRGEYRFGTLRDGTYYVAVTGKPWYAGRQRDPAGPLARAGYAATYYPNTRDVRAATPLEVKPGQEATANFTLAVSAGATLTVSVKETQPGSTRLDLMFEGIAGSQGFARIETVYGGPAVFQGVEPGRYTLRARRTDGGKALYASQTVVMGGQDASVQLTLAPGPVVAGKVRMEDGAAIPEGAYVELENEVERIHTRRAVAPDGTFEFDAMAPGSYRPLLGTSSKMYPLRGVVLDGAAVKEDMIEIVRPAKLELTASLSGGEIRGEVYRDGKPVEGVLALLAPRKDSMNPLDYRGFQTDSDGSFEWSALPAGEYVLIVKEDWYDLEYANPAAVRGLMNDGRAVTVAGTELQKIRVELK
ncbi:MAG TPA: carboxypeptidase regulatory-like domain-containing protein [Candidatus Solibacter sp.]|jgi:protocatechuate 3,4-dioxygenase beta subunit